MDWVTALWATLIGACVAIALPFLFVAIWHRRVVHLFFVAAVGATVAIAIAEFTMMRAESVQQFATALRWVQVPIFLLVVSIVGFLRLYFGTGRLWLGIAACAVRFVCLIVDFLSPLNLNFREITALQHLRFMGETVSTPVGVLSPWTHLAELSSLLLLGFVLDATINLWRQQKPDSRRRALIVGGSITFFTLFAAGVTALIHLKIIQAPYLVSFPFVAIVVAMAFELGYELFAGTQLATKLRKTEERVILAAQAAHLGVWEMNATTNEIWMSDAARALFEFDPEIPVTHEVLQDRVHPEDRAFRDSAVKQAIELHSGYELEYRILVPDGAVRWIGGRARCVADGNNKPMRLLGVSIDVTERKLAEEEARRHREEINRLSRNALLGEMTASIAHELNQPLTAIVNNADAGQCYIDEGDINLETLREMLVDIAADGHRAHDVVSNIRNTIKKGATLRESVDLNSIVTKVAHMFEPDMTAHSCELETSLVKDLPTIEANPVQIHQVLINLVSNALDAMNEAPPARRKVRIVTKRNGAGSIEVAVRDWGTGISNEAHGRLFDQFFTTKEKGIGMGLAIVRSIIEAHSGTIEAENLQGGGARFYFTLPISQETAQ